MPRQPEVFVHELEPEQAQRLVRIDRTSKDRVRLRRAGIVLASVQGRPVSVIAQMFAAGEGYVREVIHAFNDTGFAALDPKWSGGRPRKYGAVAHQLICQTARATPSALGLPFTTWSLTKLAEYTVAERSASVSGHPSPGDGGRPDHRWRTLVLPGVEMMDVCPAMGSSSCDRGCR